MLSSRNFIIAIPIVLYDCRVNITSIDSLLFDLNKFANLIRRKIDAFGLVVGVCIQIFIILVREKGCIVSEIKIHDQLIRERLTTLWFH